jgi:hypothetical protein
MQRAAVRRMMQHEARVAPFVPLSPVTPPHPHPLLSGMSDDASALQSQPCSAAVTEAGSSQLQVSVTDQSTANGVNGRGGSASSRQAALAAWQEQHPTHRCLPLPSGLQLYANLVS